MSLKQEIETWVSALAHYDNNEFEEALKAFESIADTSKILFNCGVIHATLGEHEKAVDCYLRAVGLDQYFAVAYFQQGVSNFLMGDFEEALANFNDTLLYLRGNNNIDYEQLGLKFKLYSCETLFNRGLCYIYLQQKEAGMKDLEFAAKEKVVPDHDVIDEAIREQAEGYTVFSIPVGIVYRPNEAKVKNLKTKDYLGKARLVAASDRQNVFTGFAGAERLKYNEGISTTSSAKDDRPAESLSFAATNLVKPELQSRGRQQSEADVSGLTKQGSLYRTRQQSEPAIPRNMFPPTPPPESERPGPAKVGGQDGAPMSRAQSVRGGGPKPRPPEPGRASYEAGDEDKLRLGTMRSASERPRRASEDVFGRSASRREIGRAGTYRGGEAPRRRFSEADEADEYSDELYDMYQGPKAPAPAYARRKPSVQCPTFIEEEEDDYDGSDFDDAEFEMVSRAKSRRAPQRTMSRRPEIRKIRVKVHAEDTRYVIVGVAVELRDLVDQIRQKFGLRRDFRIKVKDEGDMITVADQEDLDMALKAAVQIARREGGDMGKMEVWIDVVS